MPSTFLVTTIHGTTGYNRLHWPGWHPHMPNCQTLVWKVLRSDQGS